MAKTKGAAKREIITPRIKDRETNLKNIETLLAFSGWAGVNSKSSMRTLRNLLSLLLNKNPPTLCSTLVYQQSGHYQPYPDSRHQDENANQNYGHDYPPSQKTYP